MPNQPATPNRNVRISDELWDLVKRVAADDGVTATDVVIRSLKRTVRERYPWEHVPD